MCTAAERSYALEAWRHLDPDAVLIPHAQRQKRFVCVPSGLKDVAAVMGLPGHPWGPEPCIPGNSAMPLAIIIDDRTDVRPCYFPVCLLAMCEVHCTLHFLLPLSLLGAHVVVGSGLSCRPDESVAVTNKAVKRVRVGP